MKWEKFAKVVGGWNERIKDEETLRLASFKPETKLKERETKERETNKLIDFGRSKNDVHVSGIVRIIILIIH